MDPIAVSFLIVEATLEMICRGMIMRMIFLSFCDKNGLILNRDMDNSNRC